MRRAGTALAGLPTALDRRRAAAWRQLRRVVRLEGNLFAVPGARQVEVVVARVSRFESVSASVEVPIRR